MEVLAITGHLTRVEMLTSGTTCRVLLAHLVGCGAATGTSARSTCRPPAETRTTRRAIVTSSVFVSQAPPIL